MNLAKSCDSMSWCSSPTVCTTDDLVRYFITSVRMHAAHLMYTVTICRGQADCHSLYRQYKIQRLRLLNKQWLMTYAVYECLYLPENLSKAGLWSTSGVALSGHLQVIRP